MEEYALELQNLLNESIQENQKLKSQISHMKTLLDQMQDMEMKKTKRRISPKWEYFKEKRQDERILNDLCKMHNLSRDKIPWQMIKEKTDEMYDKITE